MRKLLIVDPTLASLLGHSYNYNLAIYQAARAQFGEIVLYTDRAFAEMLPAGLACRPVLNRLRIDTLKRWVNAAFHPFRGAKPAAADSAGSAAHATVLPNVWPWAIRLAKRLRVLDLGSSLSGILREHGDDEVHVLMQHAHLPELIVADRLRRSGVGGNGKPWLHLVLRYSPELVNAEFFTEPEFRALLLRLDGPGRPRVQLLTDSERLSAEYRALGVRNVATLPVPILLPEEPPPAAVGETVDISFLGSARVEKGFCEIPRIIGRLPRNPGGRPLRAVVQYTRDSADPRIRAGLAELQALARAAVPGSVRLLESPVPMEVYYGWVREAGIVVLPYLSDKYNASTSGIFVEAVCFGVPVLAPANSWMSDMIEEAQRAQGLRIGEVFSSLDEIPDKVARMAAGIERYRGDVRRYSSAWRAMHNPDACVRTLLAAAAA